MSNNRFGDILEIAKNQGEEAAYEEEQVQQPEVTPKAKRGRPKVGKRSNTDYTQITAYIRSATHKNTKIALIEQGSERDMGDLIDELLSEWLKSHK
jgi:hypothetical protein